MNFGAESSSRCSTARVGTNSQVPLAALGLAAILLAGTAVAIPLAYAGETRFGLELQGGMGQYTVEDPWVRSFEDRWRLEGGAGLFAEVDGAAGLKFGTGLAYRRVGDELRGDVTFDGLGGRERIDYHVALAVDQLALPIRVEHAVPGVPMLAVELGVQAEYILRAMLDEQLNPVAMPARPARPYAQIFEAVGTFGGNHDITNRTNRLGATATAGLTWRTRLLSHDAALIVRYERGLTPLWKDGFDRFANRTGLSLRWAF